jgi:hypothetical protein
LAVQKAKEAGLAAAGIVDHDTVAGARWGRATGSGCERLGLDYDRDVLPLSMAHRGGSVTERHFLFAPAKGDYALLNRYKAAFRDYLPAGRDECPDIEAALRYADLRAATERDSHGRAKAVRREDDDTGMRGALPDGLPVGKRLLPRTPGGTQPRPLPHAVQTR